MKILCIDLEATCWDHAPGPRGEGSFDPYVSEIIEVGVAILDTTSPEITKEQILIKPIASPVSEFCTNLTGLTQERLDADGLSKADAWDRMSHIWKKGRYWCSWGNYDMKQLMTDSENFGLKMPFHPVWHNNVKTTFGLFFAGGKSAGLGTALDRLGMKFEGRPHCGADDAYNLARIVRFLRVTSYQIPPMAGSKETT